MGIPLRSILAENGCGLCPKKVSMGERNRHLSERGRVLNELMWTLSSILLNRY